MHSTAHPQNISVSTGGHEESATTGLRSAGLLHQAIYSAELVIAQGDPQQHGRALFDRTSHIALLSLPVMAISARDDAETDMLATKLNRDKMRAKTTSFILGLLTAALTFSTSLAQPADPGWPRIFKDGKQQLTLYQPQVDYWNGYTNIHFRSAIAVKGVSKQEKFGVAEVDALTVTDHNARIVALVPLKRELRFANVPEPELTKLRQAVEKLHPSGQVTTLSLDRVIAYLDPAKQPVQQPVEVSLDPPRIFTSTMPASWNSPTTTLAASWTRWRS